MRNPAVAARRGWLAAPWTSSPKLGLGLIVASCLVGIGVAALGPSSVTLNIGPATGPLPPWSVPADVGVRLGLPPSEWQVVPALWLALVAGAVGLAIATRAVGAGWRPRVRRLFLLGVGLSTATALVPPMTSADVLSYAAYGRLQRLGVDPYDITPADVFRQAFDPVLIWTERPWQDTPSVYGPIASASQLLANLLGGDSMHHIVFWLQVFNLVPFLAIGALLVRLTAGDAGRQARAVLFTVANPLLISAIVAGAHNEAMGVMFAVAGLFLMRRNAFAVGVCLGLAGATKVSMVFFGIAMVWGYRRQARQLAALIGGTVVTLAVAYGLFAPHALFAAARNTGYISQGSWALPLVFVLQPLLGDAVARDIVSKLGWVLLVPIAWMLSRLLGWEPVPGARVPAREDPLTIAARTSVALCGAWVLTSPWSLPWYDLMMWAPLALVTASRLDGALMVRGGALSVAYVTARSVQFGPAMLDASWLLREVLCAGIAIGVLVWIVRWWWRSGHDVPTRDFIARGWSRLITAWS